MPIEATLALVLPDAFDRADAVVAELRARGLVVAEREVLSLAPARAADFFRDAAAAPAADGVAAHAAAGPLLALVLRGEGAVAMAREVAAALGGGGGGGGGGGARGVLHVSESAGAAAREVAFFFPKHAPVCASGKAAKEWLGRTVGPTLTTAMTEMCRLMPEDPERWLGERLLASAQTKAGDSGAGAAAVSAGAGAGADAGAEMNGNGVAKEAGDGGAVPVSVPAAGAPGAAAEEGAGAAAEEEAGAGPRAALPKIYFVLGNAGTGKGTQCGKLVEKYGFAHLSAGDLLRAEVASGSDKGEMISALIKEGKIVPGEVTIGLLKTAIAAAAADGVPGILIDGFPRALSQAGAFEKDVADFEFCLFFDCPEDELERRLLGRGETSGRTDDNIDSIRKRFSTFRNTCYPVIEYYLAKGKAHRIESTSSIDDVFTKVDALFTPIDS